MWLTYLVENLLRLPDLDVVDGFGRHPSAATDPFQISLIQELKTHTQAHLRQLGDIFCRDIE